MKRLALCLLLLVPAGCADHQPSGSDPQAYCARQADHDPEVMKLTMKNMTTGVGTDSLRPEIGLARQRALQRCLRKQGVVVRGGVEPIEPR